ncbi:MAG: outer membrane protein assembly factor BamB family protein [Pirellulales bacterium]
MRRAAKKLSLALVFILTATVAVRGEVPTASDAALVQASGVQGGLLVVVGAQGAPLAAEAAGTGRYLVQVLDSRAEAVERARQSIRAKGLYGLASADQINADGKLPYTENLVNLLVIADPTAGNLSLAEAGRVLSPGGILVVPAEALAQSDLAAAGFEQVRSIDAGRAWLAAAKPRPKAMDEWAHPRHGPDGNAVSQDTMVGPPRRVRWIAGPPQEVSNLVTSAGRNFYAGVTARDAFNGLRLWQRPLAPSPARGGFSFRTAPGSVRPIADGDRLYVVTDKRLTALDAATGEKVREYPEAGTPLDVILVEKTLIAIDANSVRAVEIETGKLRWQYTAVEPRCVAAGDGGLYLIHGKAGGEPVLGVALDLAKGEVRWKHDFAWLAKVRGLVYHDGLLAYEISTVSDEKLGNMIHVVSAAEGKPLWNRTFVPGMAHMKQARAMFAGDSLWILDDHKCTSLDAKTGAEQKTCPAGWGHCFPPVATETYLFAGELDMTNLATGKVEANRITKGACGRDAGFVPANGLVYTAPKHCTCWPMLRDYTALAPARPEGDAMPARPEAKDFLLEQGPAAGRLAAAGSAASPNGETDWPCYRHDAWRSGSTTARVPARLKTLWKVTLGGWPEGDIASDWRANSFTRGPITPPVSAGALVYVARIDAHEVLALDAKSGQTRWTFTANGRVDTSPTIHEGLCLFGTRSGWVYCLRADDGRLVWRLRAAPCDERIVAYGQVESPWPVPGSVVVIDGVAFFAAGRQPLADGGVLVFAAEPATGKIVWVQRLDTVPQTNFYGASGHEFKSFDLLQQEGGAVAMSRWLFDRGTGKMVCDGKNGFAHLVTGGSGVMAPRGFWSYGPRYESEQVQERPFLEPLVAFRDNTLFGGSQERKAAYRRDFQLTAGEKFDAEWYAKWPILEAARKGGDMWRSQRLAHKAAWSQNASAWLDGQGTIAAMTLTSDALFVAGSKGGLAAISPKDGVLVGQSEMPAPVWDGLAATSGRLVATTRDGEVVCLGQAE